MSDRPCSRAVLLYRGGKFRIAPWIVSHFPPHRMYLEPFCGAASVLLQKPRSYCEVINDLDSSVVTLFRVLRDQNQSAELMRMLRLTPYSRDELVAAYEEPTLPEDPVRQAWRLMVRSWMSVVPDKCVFNTTLVRKSGPTQAPRWSQLPDALEAVTERMSGVLIENKPAMEVIVRFDASDALIYCDPPYISAVMDDNIKKSYSHDMSSDEEHIELSELLRSCHGYVIISSYQSELYNDLYRDWHVVETKTTRRSVGDGGLSVTECLWISPRTWDALQPGPLFREG